jgi:hypothetical protein
MSKNEAETKEFPTADVLSAVTGFLMGEMGGLYKLLNWMTGEDVFTHQIPRVIREAQPVLVAAHPGLQQAIDESDDVNKETVSHWKRTWEDRYGPTMAVPKFNSDTHESIDPLSELAEKVHPDKIITVKV